MKTFLCVSAIALFTASTSFSEKLDPRLLTAARIAERDAASPDSKPLCWGHVVDALWEAGALRYFIKSHQAIDALDDLPKQGFKKLPITNPRKAPEGSILIYSTGKGYAGHSEIKTPHGYVGYFFSKTPCNGVWDKKRKKLIPAKLVAVFAKFGPRS